LSTTLFRALTAAAVLLVLVAVNVSIVAKESIKSQGELILLELAPVDPRSLMQGDYMALRFTLAEAIDPQVAGPAAVVIDEKRVATLAPNPAAATLFVRYRVRNGQVWLGTNAYFFEEGSAARFEQARYGEFRVDRDTGEAVLTGLRDINQKPL
jgi:uncharacterized membrane-anchored protein